MRHMIMLTVWIAILVCHTLVAQPIDSLRPVVLSDSTHHIFSLNYHIGTTPVTAAPLNEFLAQHGYGSDRFSTEAFDNLALGVGMSMTIKRWLIEPEISGILPVQSSRSGTDIAHGFWAVQANVGYQILQAGDRNAFALYPFSGLGARTNRLTIAENPQTTFAAIFSDSSSRSYSFSNEVLYGEVGIGADYGIAISQNEQSMTSLVFGLRAGYQFGILSEDWRQSGNDQRITDGPDIKPHGVSAWLTVGWRIQPRIYDAHIVAERRSVKGEEAH